MRSKIYMLPLVLLWHVASSAQTLNPGIPLIDNYSRQHYGANNDNWAIEQDDRGVMFFGNSAGILEFDGNHWRNIAPGILVYDMNKASNGVIYVTMDNDFGYIGYNEIGASKYYSLLEHYRPSDDYVGTFYNQLEVDDTYYFLSNRGYLYRLTNSELTLICLPERNSGRYKTLRFVNNSLYLQTPDGLATLSDSTYRLIENGAYFKDKSIEEIFQNGQDTVMIVTRLNGLYQLTADGFTPLESDGSDFIKKNQVYVANKVDDKRFVFGSIQKGVLLTDRSGKIIFHIDREGGLQSNDHCEIFTDKNKNIWSGLENGISSIYLNSPFTQLNEHYNLPLAKVYSMIIHNEQFYVGTAQGAYFAEMNPQHRAHLNFNYVNEPGVRKVMDMVEFDDQIIISTSGTGTFIVDGNRTTKISDYTFRQLLPYDENHLIGTLFYGGIGVLKRNGKKWNMHHTFQNLPQMEFCTMDEAKNIWVVEDEKRVMNFQFSLGMDSLENVQYFSSLDQVTSFDSVSIFNVENKVLFGTAQGTYQYNNGEFQKFEVLNQAMNHEVFVEIVRKDKNGTSWFLGSLGADVVLGKINTLANGQFQIENYIAPLQRLSDYLIGMFYPYDDENIFIGTSERIIHFNPTKSDLTRQAFSIAIRSVEITKPGDSLLFGGEFVLDDVLYKEQPNRLIPSIKFRNNAIRIRYSALYYESPKQVKYRCKLKGFDKEWSEWTGKPVKEYNFLPEGKYTFMVKASNVYDVESTIVSYTFVIKPPWYRTIGAFFMYLILFILLVYFLVKYSQRRLVKENEQLESTISERTAEVVKQKQEIESQNKTLVAQNAEIRLQAEQLNELNQLKDRLFSIISHDLRSPILSLFTLLSMTKDKVVSEQRFWAEIDKLSQRVGHTRELTENLLNWAHSQMEGFTIKPQDFQLAALINHKVLFIKETADEKGIQIINKVDAGISVFADKNMIDLVVRNLLANAIKFCKTGDLIVVSAVMQNDFIEVKIADTGIGIANKKKEKVFGKEVFSTLGTQKEKGSGLGLMLCKDFIELNGGSIWFESTEGQGSRFFITIPIGGK